MINKNFNYILGSKSPRRKELLKLLGISFDIKTSDIAELKDGLTPQKLAQENARRKAEEVLKDYGKENSIIISADTVVHQGDRLWGKPKDLEEARAFLLALEDSWHEVTTAVALATYRKNYLFSVTTAVHFIKIDRDFLESYLRSGDSLDKAGGYGIQGPFQRCVDRIEGSYSNVVGLPIAQLGVELEAFMKEL